jgi:hypothetical protein
VIETEQGATRGKGNIESNAKDGSVLILDPCMSRNNRTIIGLLVYFTTTRTFLTGPCSARGGERKVKRV